MKGSRDQFSGTRDLGLKAKQAHSMQHRRSHSTESLNLVLSSPADLFFVAIVARSTPAHSGLHRVRLTAPPGLADYRNLFLSYIILNW
jgi:hypothetical protein